MSVLSSLPDIRQAAQVQNFDRLLESTKGEGHGKKDKLRFGWFGFTPDFLQVFNTPKWLLFFMSCAAMLDFANWAFTAGTISTLEKRFEMSSSQSGFIFSAYEIFGLITVPILTHISGKVHKGKILGIGTLLFGVGAFLFASPHFYTGPYEAPGTYADNMTSSQMPDTTCQSSTNGSYPEQCGGETTQSYSAMSRNLYMFVACEFLICLCGGPVNTVGIAYLDENVKKTVSGMYAAVLYTMAFIGEGIGYVVIGELLSIYVEWPKEDGYSAGLTPWDPRWVGNWWLGFPILGLLAFLVSFPLLGYPRKLPESDKLEGDEEKLKMTSFRPMKDVMKNAEDDVIQADGEQEGVASKGKILQSFKEFLRSLVDLGKCYSFVLLTFGLSIDSISWMGIVVFAPKLCELLFGLPETASAMYFGLSSVPGIAIGSLLGGWISKKIGVNCKKIMLYIVVVHFASTLMTPIFLMQCPEPAKAYVSQGVNMTCSTDCGCADSLYDPVCGGNGVEYQSPCHAGCADFNATTMIYSNCSCIRTSGVESDVTGSVTSFASLGACPRECRSYVVPVLFTILFFQGMVFSTSMPTVTAVTLRLVPNKLRSFGLGMQWTLFRLIAFIPGPIIYGAALDNACVQWQTDSCRQRGACLVYDSRKVGLFVVGLTMGLGFVGQCLLVIAYLVYKPAPRDSSDESDD